MNLEQVDQALVEQAELGDAVAQFELSMQLPLEHEQHLVLLKSSAEKGNEQAMLCMAKYEQQQQNFENVIFWLNQAKALNNATACFQLAEIYKNGQGLPVNLKQSLEYYQCAAELGHTEAFFELFKIYKEGLGISKCEIQAERYLNLAKKNQHIEAASIEM